MRRREVIGGLSAAAMAATSTIPIVAYMSDPVAYGLVTSLARPSGNIIGIVSDAGLEISGKHVELLKEATGERLSRIGYLASRTSSRAPIVWSLEGAAEALGISVVAGTLDDFQEQDYRRAFLKLKRGGVDGVVVINEAESYSNRDLIVGLAAQNALPCTYPERIFVQAGGLLSYGPDLRTCTGAQRLSLTRSSRELIQPRCQWSGPPNSNSSSISRPPMRSASQSRPRSSPALMR